MSNTDLDMYEEGDIPSKWLPSVANNDMDELEGEWELLLERSEPCDEIMIALGLGYVKRTFLARHKTKLHIKIFKEEKKIHILTLLPMGIKKEAMIDTAGGITKQEDPDVGVTWTTESIYSPGRLLQKRTSSLGTMYDVRCVFQTDPENISTEAPLQLFKWTFINVNGNKQTANRWLKKVK